MRSFFVSRGVAASPPAGVPCLEAGLLMGQGPSAGSRDSSTTHFSAALCS